MNDTHESTWGLRQIVDSDSIMQYKHLGSFDQFKVSTVCERFFPSMRRTVGSSQLSRVNHLYKHGESLHRVRKREARFYANEFSRQSFMINLPCYLGRKVRNGLVIGVLKYTRDIFENNKQHTSMRCLQRTTDFAADSREG